MNDLVSIVIPAYKAANYLAEAIESAMAQTYPNYEIIVVNDGSPDDGATREVALRYQDRIRYFEKENGGCASALNYGIQTMKGKWFSWLSHDDLYMPEKLDVLLRLKEAHGDLGEKVVLGANYKILNARGELKPNLYDNSVGVIPPEKAFGETLNVSTFNGCSLLIPRAAFDEVGTFHTDYKHLLDRELWMRLALHGYSYLFAREPLAINRTHNQQVTVQAKNILFEEEQRLIQEYATLLAGQEKAAFLRELTYFAYKRKHYEDGKKLKAQLRSEGALDMSTRAKLAKYSVEGRAKSLVRGAYKAILRK